MKKLVKAKYIYINNKFVKNASFVFDEKIIEVADFDLLKKKYDNIEILNYENQIILPGLINVHQHLEFSANQTSLTYGAFMPWLHSVIENRQDLMQQCSDDMIKKNLTKQLRCGTTTIGEISSSGVDLAPCANAKQRVVFFNELIGSNPAMVDALYGDFNSRLNASQSHKSDKFFPALAIHSPYSVHPILLKKALKQAKDEDLRISTHFLESEDEREWLNQSSGGFLSFFEKFFGLSKSVNSADEFLNAFENGALFTHCNYANQKQKEILQNHFVTHCPVSNRLLGSNKLDIKTYENLCLATDGLSSNISLSLFDEMRNAFMLHHEWDLNSLAHKLLKAVTTNPAKALNLPVGEIKKQNYADFIVLNPLEIKDENNIAAQIILQTKEVDATYINGVNV